jgi:hypothetical protein
MQTTRLQYSAADYTGKPGAQKLSFLPNRQPASHTTPREFQCSLTRLYCEAFKTAELHDLLMQCPRQ